MNEVAGSDMLVLVQRYRGKAGVKPVMSLAEYEEVMQWGVEHFRSNLSGYYHCICFRSTMMHLCHFYGYIPESFSHSAKVYIDHKRCLRQCLSCLHQQEAAFQQRPKMGLALLACC